MLCVAHAMLFTKDYRSKGAMTYGLKVVATVVAIVFFANYALYAQDSTPSAPGSVNLKVGESFYFEGKTDQKEDDQKEASMAEIKRVPFYETTWFIATVTIIAIAGAGTGIYFLTKTEAPQGNVIMWKSASVK